MAERLTKTDKIKAKMTFDIILAAEMRDLEHVKKALIEDPQSVNAQHPDYGLTPLHIAAVEGAEPIVDLLLDQDGIDLTAEDGFGRKAIDLALASGNHGIAEKIARKTFPQFFETDDDPYPNGPSKTEGTSISTPSGPKLEI
ncbi:ankyrin repeat domain-containing protein [Microvirga sp. CF3062]|uniref:ankyrin repeat domain-containing protein n=1 Tax=Microvirga sp. CF3062 TaxID=3110182 RepID=UPI002E776F19|nr:ankyrin repeat domain-containing protein [Microvirga sp. CF3062]MEE1655689.1 ankyrin repeat domain-containing protein [Microvirga sp. CF3062]